MSHVFPKHLPAAGEPMDFEEVNENLRVVVNEMEGRLGEHNWGANAVTDRTDMAPDAVLDVGVSQVEVDPVLETITTRPGRGTSLTNEFLISNTPVWQTVTSITKDTGNSLCWCIASLQQQRLGTLAGGVFGAQHAISVDGNVVGESIVGGQDRANDRKGEALRSAAMAHATDIILPVTPGRRTFELVSRATRDEAYTVPDNTNSADDFEHRIYNHELILITVDPFSADLAGAGVSVTFLNEGDSLTAASLNTPFAAIETELNDLDAPSIQKESLHASHLPSPVIATGIETTGNAGTHTYTNGYSDYNSETGWTVITDGTDPLSVTLSSTVDLTDADTRGILVMADIEVVNIDDDATAGATTSVGFYAVFAIQIHVNAGAWDTIARTERYINSETDIADTTGGAANQNVRVNVPIRTFITSSDSANTIDQVRVVVATADGPSAPAGNVEVTLHHCNLVAVGLQAGS